MSLRQTLKQDEMDRRRKRIAELLKENVSRKAICERLGITERTLRLAIKANEVADQ